MQRTSNVNELRDLIDRGAGLNNGNGSQARPECHPPILRQPRTPAQIVCRASSARTLDPETKKETECREDANLRF